MKKNQKGQASIEFIISFIVALGFLVLFVSVSTNLVAGYLAHYATFTASRVFLSFETNQTPGSVYAQSEAEAERVFNRIPLRRFGIRNGELRFIQPDPANVLIYRGAYYTYRRPFSAFALFSGNAQVNYTSESYLGREPTRQECMQRVCQAMGLGTNCANPDFDVTVFDNGC